MECKIVPHGRTENQPHVHLSTHFLFVTLSSFSAFCGVLNVGITLCELPYLERCAPTVSKNVVTKLDQLIKFHRMIDNADELDFTFDDSLLLEWDLGDSDHCSLSPEIGENG